MYKIAACLLSTLFCSAIAHAADWKHNCTQASDGTKTSIDFLTAYIDHNDVGGDAGTLANPVWINVKGGGLSPDSTVSVTLVNHGYDARLSITDGIKLAQTSESRQFNLTYIPGSSPVQFTGQLTAAPFAISGVNGDYPGTAYFQTFTVFVGHDHWTGKLINPVDNSPSFEVEMSRASPNSCN